MSISGTAQVGEILTASVEPAEATASYQWQSASEQEGDYSEITDAVNNTYTLTEGESGEYIKVKAYGTGEYTGEIISDATALVTPAVQATARRKVKKTNA